MTIRCTSPTAAFLYIQFPQGGMYRILSDFYPDGATPQLIAKTVLVPGTPPPPLRSPDYSTKQGENMQVAMTTDPAEPIAGFTTQLHFKSRRGVGEMLGAWAHMLVTSDDLVDMIHTHPFIADGSPHVQFDVTFPRGHGLPRVGAVPTQRRGEPAHFDVPVSELK